MRISVAMAVFNGETYLKEQIDSILPQLKDCDELVVSVDKSTDNTLAILTAMSMADSRIRVFANESAPGVVNNFQNALAHSTGDIIFFSDQDDVWMPDKVESVMKEFSDRHVAAVIHDAHLTDSALNVIAPSTFTLRGGARASFWGNFVRLSYIGCCMAFRAEYKDVIMPIPTIYRSHDWWTGCMLACGKTRLAVVDRPLIYHREHGLNATPKKRPSLGYQLQVRRIIIKGVISRLGRKLAIDKSLDL